MINRKARVVAGLALLGAIALIASGASQAAPARTRVIGSERIIGMQPLSEADEESCPFPGSPPLGLAAAVPRQARSGAVGAPQVRARVGNIDQKPARFIKDPNPAWSSIAVNAENDMVVMTDENLYRVVEYSRLNNTPPTGAITEPRRVISGDNTRMEMLCGSYVDPKTLEVYVTNNDTQDWMPVFSREARGNVAPDRLLATPHRAWGITADETRQELFMTIQSPSAVIVYRKTAANNDAPLRFLEGDATALADPHGIALDMKTDLMIISNHGHRRFYGGPAISTLTRSWEEWIAPTDDLNSLPRRMLPGLGTFEMPSINIYARGASGNTPPLRVIKGPRTQLNWPSHVAVHEDRGEIFVANDADDSVLVFREADSGDVAPIRAIKGPHTKVKFPIGLSMDARNGELWVASMGNFTATVFPVTANGDVAPLRNIRGGPPDTMALMIGNPGAVGYDSKRQEILVPN
jgi:DNA-binding beta-propeller fold protein YncE